MGQAADFFVSYTSSDRACISRRILGNDHPATLAIQDNLATIRRASQDGQEP